MGRWEDKTNAERGRRNAEQQGEVERRGELPQATPVMMFRVPRSAFRVLAALWRLNLAEELQYRANFVASVLGTVFWIVTALLTLAVFFSHTTRLGGWDYWEVVVLLGVFNALTGVIEAVLRPGIGRLAGEVRSEERRVGKEWRSRGWACLYTEKRRIQGRDGEARGMR